MDEYGGKLSADFKAVSSYTKLKDTLPANQRMLLFPRKLRDLDVGEYSQIRAKLLLMQSKTLQLLCNQKL